MIPGLGGSPGEGSGNPLQYSCLGNPMDWQGVEKTWTQLSDRTAATTIKLLFLMISFKKLSFIIDIKLPVTSLITSQKIPEIAAPRMKVAFKKLRSH